MSDDVVARSQPLVCVFCERTDGGPFYYAWRLEDPVLAPKIACKRCLLERGVELPPERGCTAKCE